jgi:hypothetical protein
MFMQRNKLWYLGISYVNSQSYCSVRNRVYNMFTSRFENICVFAIFPYQREPYNSQFTDFLTMVRKGDFELRLMSKGASDSFPERTLTLMVKFMLKLIQKKSIPFDLRVVKKLS